MAKETAREGSRKVDVTIVKRGQLAKMARSNAVPSPELRAAIIRAAERRR